MEHGQTDGQIDVMVEMIIQIYQSQFVIGVYNSGLKNAFKSFSKSGYLDHYPKSPTST